MSDQQLKRIGLIIGILASLVGGVIFPILSFLGIHEIGDIHIANPLASIGRLIILIVGFFALLVGLMNLNDKDARWMAIPMIFVSIALLAGAWLGEW